MKETSQTGTWNEQLRKWCENTGKPLREIAHRAGIPRETFRCYVSGLTNEQIKAKYRMDSPYQICGFASQYAQHQKKK